MMMKDCRDFDPDCLILIREKSSPNCGRGAHTAPATQSRIKKTRKQPITCFGSCFQAIRWSTVRVFQPPAPPPVRSRYSSLTASLIAS